MFSQCRIVRKYSGSALIKLPFTDERKSFNLFLEYHEKILVFTGSKVSTESGIPNLKTEKVGVLGPSSNKIIQYSDFMKNTEARKRFWAKSYFSWPKFISYQPNRVHFFIAALQATKANTKLITENMDGMHSKAGSPNVLELFGNAYWVICTNCKNVLSRLDFQRTLENENPDFEVSSESDEVQFPYRKIRYFKVPSCENCEGILKPAILFDGQTVSDSTFRKAEKLIDECDSVLLLGSSLSSPVCYALIEKAYDLGKFLCLINLGYSKADNFADIKINAKISDVIFENRKGEFLEQ